MGSHMEYTPTYLPRKLKAEIKRTCEKMQAKLGEYYSMARFLRDAATAHLNKLNGNVLKGNKSK